MAWQNGKYNQQKGAQDEIKNFPASSKKQFLNCNK
jgi:hypothetical protein